MIFRNFTFFMGIVFSFMYYLIDFDIDMFLLRSSLCMTLVVYIFYYINGLNHDKVLFSSWSRPSNLLLLGLLIVNFQTIANVCFGLSSISDYLKTPIYSIYTGKVLFLSISCFLGILSGLSTNVGPFALKKNDMISNDNEFRFWTFLTLIFLCSFVYNIDVHSFISGTDYVGSGAVDRVIKDSSYFEQLLTCSIIIVLGLQVKKKSAYRDVTTFKDFIVSFPSVFLLSVGIYFILRLLSGDRGPIIYTSCAFMYAYWMLTKKRMSLVRLILIVFFAASAVTLLGEVRDLDKDISFFDRINNVDVMKAKEDLPSICSQTQELANSVNCNFIAVGDINAKKTDYKYGAYNLIAMIGSVPGSSFVLSKILGVNLRDYMTSEYVTISYFGPDYPLGLGTTAVADFFLDFGAFFSFLLFYSCGLLYRKLDYVYTKQNVTNVSIYAIIAILKVSSIAIYTSRFSFAGTMSSALYVVIVFWVIHKLFFQNKTSWALLKK